MAASDIIENKHLKMLRAEWLLSSLFYSACLGLAYLLLRDRWMPTAALLWLVIAGGFALYQFHFLGRRLIENRLSSGEGGLLPNLGWANHITIFRGVLIGAMAGFLADAWPAAQGLNAWLAWAPGVLYILAAVLDFVDGYVARVTGRTTCLGEALDMQWDGVGVLIGAALAVRYEQAPLGFLLVGLARFVFVFGAQMRTRRGLPLYDLDPSMIRRALAGVQMGFIGAVLLPVFTPPATRVAAILFMLPFLGHFLRDFLWVSGVLRPRSATRKPDWLRAALPLILRAVQVGLLSIILIVQLRSGSPAVGVLLVVGLALPAFLLGVAGRLFALAVLFMAGFELQVDPLNLLYWLLLLVSPFLFIVGTGRFSLWKPEDWLIYHRAGEAHR